jgi:hypothetical protein
MDPVTIGAAVVTILAPYVADAGKEMVKTVGEAGVEKTKELMKWLKGKFAGDPVASTDLSRFEKDPTGYAKPLQDTIETKVKEDPAFSAEITKRMNDLQPYVKIIQEFEEAQGVTGVEGNINSGQLDLTQKGRKGTNIVGVKGSIG